MKKKHFLLGFLLSIFSTTYADVVTSIRPLGFIAAAITDGVTNVKILLPDGISPHDYFLKPSDLIKIKTADLFIWVGSDLETFLKKPLSQLPNHKRVSLIEDQAIKKLLLKNTNHNHVIDNNLPDKNRKNIFHYHSHAEYNMHIWLSPCIARIIANIIHHRLVILYPKYKKYFDKNLRYFEEQITKTDENLNKMLQTIKYKRYFVFHDAYSYFEKRYSLASLGYFIINPNIHPGAKKLHKIRTTLIQEKAICVFAEPQFRPAIIQAVIKDTNVHMGTLDPLGGGIELNKDSYVEFLAKLSNQFKNCLDKN
ncbi:High-affinity zinc uptake system protein ZnuA precursor [Candidatus Arsenophonus lipoptenae]|uniref:High-affinity zinc uptake system protein ZnuA n=1 Tax=Candidatus Arsenophonus lipoptenae TaxID=634113 RepID=A0A0X9W2Q1_9GAMM|nr:zinc ABC transporter substrate-binding protein ZnuA [Candidatus Arsenophonus lipoptenae]AMA64789.1 High-affinity zinc uptake system protein ZnuA precursor [Candidatus Arsenophonus lipoptenae]